MPTTLLIGKDVQLATKYQSEIGDHGHRVKTVPDIKTGLKFATQNDLDLIILDLRLPKIEDGLRGLERLRRDSTTKDIPILILPILDQVGGMTG